jgi:D-arabinose 1-dehydrogenase-like Zn-dependent alcohol dehydrogenase
MNFNDKTLLITGIGNFIGLRIAEIAIANGIEVRGLEGSVENAKKAENLGAKVFIGTTNDEDGQL